MASRLNPYLNFRGQAREALELYASVFGGDDVDAPHGCWERLFAGGTVVFPLERLSTLTAPGPRG